jgi:hypothetical protein
MQLSDILEENSVRGISQKTKISENNLDNLLARNFNQLKKVKTLGFISIIEREYNADLDDLREEANSHYAQSVEDRSITLGLPIVEEKKGKSKFFMLVIITLLGYATWYFLTQFDKKHLSEMIPFIDESTIESFMDGIASDEDEVKELSIGAVKVKPEVAKMITPVAIVEDAKEENLNQAESVTKDVPEEIVENNDTPSSDTVEITEMVEDINPAVTGEKHISIVPESRLWFGLIDMSTNQRDHFSISDTFKLDVTDKSWLVATSSAPFSLQESNESKEFNDAKEHYFKIDKNAIDELSKDTYIALGGWPQW